MSMATNMSFLLCNDPRAEGKGFLRVFGTPIRLMLTAVTIHLLPLGGTNQQAARTTGQRRRPATRECPESRTPQCDTSLHFFRYRLDFLNARIVHNASAVYLGNGAVEKSSGAKYAR
jgi:hypothetical protein